MQTADLRREISELNSKLQEAEIDESALQYNYDKQATSMPSRLAHELR